MSAEELIEDQPVEQTDDLVVERVNSTTNEVEEVGFNGVQAEVVHDLQEQSSKLQTSYQQRIAALEHQIKQPKRVGFTWDGISYYCPYCGNRKLLTQQFLEQPNRLDRACSCKKAHIKDYQQYRIYQYKVDF